MGLFSKIKKGLSKAWKGIKRGFKSVLGKVGKFLSSGWGKALMIVAGVVTMGAALAAGAAAYSAAAAANVGFMGSLSAGASAALSSLTGGLIGTSAEGLKAGFAAGAKTTGQAAKIAAQTQQATQLSNVAGAAGETVAKTGQEVVKAGGAAGETISAGEKLARSVGMGSGAPASATAQATQSATGGMLRQAASGIGKFAKNPVGTTIEGVTRGAQGAWNWATGLGGAPATSTTAAQPGLLKRAATGLYNFATSEGGGPLLGKVVEGYAQGRALEEQAREERKQRRRLDKQWRDFDWGQEDLDINLGRGGRERAQRTAMDLDRSSRIDNTTAMSADRAAGYT